MAPWLVSLIAAIIEPALKQLLAKWGYQIDEAAISKQESSTAEAVVEEVKAKTLDERKKAIQDLANSANNS